MEKKGMIAAIIAAVVVGVGFIVLVILWGANRFTIQWNATEKQQIHWEYGEAQPDMEVTAVLKGKLFYKKGKPLTIHQKNAVDCCKTGEQKVEYTVKSGIYSSKLNITYMITDTVAPVITLVSDPEHFTSPIASYEEEGYSAFDAKDKDVTDKVVREEKDGKVYYTVTDSSGNTAVEVRTIVYKDVVPPVIQLTGEAAMNWNLGSDYQEPGFLATDDCEGDISDRVQVSGTVDATKVGEYTLTYQVQDSYGNTTEATRVVSIRDIVGPAMGLLGNSVCYVERGTGYSDAGCTAVDTVDGKCEVTVSGGVDSNTCGTYSINYSSTDKSGNTSYASRMVYVFEKQGAVQTQNPGNKVVYLTFDDGPGKYTQKLLDVLDKYNVKVTFFVTNQFSQYESLIAEEARRGHTVAVHTYTHRYQEVYASVGSFLEDFQKENERIKAQTGSYAWLTRFPGGSSTTYIKGRKDSFTQALANIGVQYCDWNVSSGDAGGTSSAAQVVANVTSGISQHNVSVVLQHDIHGYSVDAVEQIIVWGLANGYTFLPLTPSSPMVHHGA